MKSPISFDEFKDHYFKTGFCMGASLQSRKKPLNDKQLLTKYKSYKRKFLKADNSFKVDEQWLATKEQVYNRDQGECQLISKLTHMEFMTLVENSGFLIETLDPAHVFGKGAFPKLKYNPDNVYTLNRFSHSMLDTQKHPLTGTPITKVEKEYWWKRIAGESNYLALEKLTQFSKHK